MSELGREIRKGNYGMSEYVPTGFTTEWEQGCKYCVGALNRVKKNELVEAAGLAESGLKIMEKLAITIPSSPDTDILRPLAYYYSAMAAYILGRLNVAIFFLTEGLKGHVDAKLGQEMRAVRKSLLRVAARQGLPAQRRKADRSRRRAASGPVHPARKRRG